MKPLAALSVTIPAPLDSPSGSRTNPLFPAIRRRAVFVGLCIFISMLSAFAFSKSQTKQYTASASLLFRDPGFGQQIFGSPVFQAADPTRQAATNVELVSLAEVAQRTADDLGGGLSAAAVSEKVDVSADGQSDVVSIAATDPDPVFAASLANAFGQSYIRFRRDADRAKIADAKRLVERDYAGLSDAERLSKAGRSLQNQLSQLKTLEALQTGNAELVQRAEPPTTPSIPNIRNNLVVAGLFGLMFGSLGALLLERKDRRLKESEFEAAYGLPVIAKIPDSPDLSDSVGIHEQHQEDESFRMLRSRLRYFNVDHNIRALLVTSALPSEGKSTLAFHLARTAAAAGTRTVLLEADLHRPVLAKRTGVSPLPGLAELLTKQGSLAGAVQSVSVASANKPNGDGRSVDLIVSGTLPPNTTAIMESHEIQQLIPRLVEAYDLVVIDTPPINIIADVIPLVDLVDGVLVVGRLGISTHDSAKELQQQLELLGANVLGVVVNGSVRGADYYRGYGRQDLSMPKGRRFVGTGRLRRTH